MTQDIDRLKRDYQAMQAPPHLASRIRAEVSSHSVHRRWLPAVLATTMAVALILPVVWQQIAVETNSSVTVSSVSLLPVTPRKPAVRAPSLSQLRSVPTPTPPKRPTLNPTKKLKTFFDSENDHQMEKYNAYI